MLYDRRWEKPEIKADPFSLESLIAWLEKQPAEKEYDYCDARNCLIAQYLKDSGEAQYEISVSEIQRLGWREIVNPRIDYVPTFGAALTRARAVLAQR